MKIPSPGESITEVEIASWLVSEGDFVKKDQIIAEIDSDKATLELPCYVSICFLNCFAFRRVRLSNRKKETQ